MPQLPQFPISEQITQVIEATLRSCNRANGYHNDYTIQRRKKSGNTPTQSYTIILNDGDDFEPPPAPPFNKGNGGGGAPYGHQQWLRKYFLMVYILAPALPEAPAGESDAPDEVAYEQLCNVARADVEYCILQNPQMIMPGAQVAQPIAMDTYPREPAYFTDPNDLGGIAVHFDVYYRTLANNPYGR